MESSHSAAELARLSSLVHNIVGWLLLALAVVQLRETLTTLAERPVRLIWPGLGAFIGVGLALWVFFHQILTHGVGPFDDPVQNQHQAIGWLVGLGAGVELLRRKGRLRGWLASAAWGSGLVGVGVLFLVHEQHEVEALLVHWALAATLILAGLCDLSVALTGGSTRAIRVLGILILGAGSVQLIVYEERTGAHGDHGAAPAPASAIPAH